MVDGKGRGGLIGWWINRVVEEGGGERWVVGRWEG